MATRIYHLTQSVLDNLISSPDMIRMNNNDTF